MSREHIRIEERDGRLAVVADDYELYDLIDDLLVENDVASSGPIKEERDGRNHWLIVIDSGQSESEIRQLIDGIPSEEIERVWRLNITRSEG